MKTNSFSKLLLIAVLMLSVPFFAKAQKYAYVDTEYILQNIPDYKSAQGQIDNLSTQWQ